MRSKTTERQKFTTTLNNNTSDTLKKKLVAEVHEYIKNTAPNAHNTISEHLVNHCLEHNVDICFVMAQTQNETNFGTMGVGRESSRRSLFGVYKKSYVDYKAAISDYFYILKGSYLVKGKTEQDLMKNYVNSRGARYASDRYSLSPNILVAPSARNILLLCNPNRIDPLLKIT